MFVATGIGPYSGQAVHFRNFAPEPKAYAVNRYTFEAKRTGASSTRGSAKHRYMLGDTYTHRRHGGVGLGAPDPVRARAATRSAQCPTSSAMVDEISAPPGRDSVRSRSRTSTPSRPRWTRTARLAMFPHLKKAS